MRLGLNKLCHTHPDNSKTYYYKYWFTTNTDHWIYLRLGNKEYHFFKKSNK